MLTGYSSFAFRHRRPLAFGGILIFLSSFGQTFYVSLFGAGFRAGFNLTDGDLGAMYGGATLASAITLTWVGRLIDRTTVRRYTWAAAILLAGACLLTAIAPFGLMLAVCFYFLRIGGQGLMMHTALTTTARTFPKDAGKAIGIVMLCFSLALAVLPPLAVAGINLIGWRAVWVAGAMVVIGGAMLATAMLPKGGESDAIIRESRPASERALWRDHRMLLTLPVVYAAPFISTGFFFHQARLAQEKGWSLSWLAGWFAAYAVAQAVTNVTAGPVIDRLGPIRMLPIFLIPLAAAMLTLFFSTAAWTAPVYLILTGISSGIAATLATALWVELFGPERLARVRSTVQAGSIIASGASPALFGYLLDRGVPLSVQAIFCFIYIIFASALTLGVKAQPADTV